MEVIVKTIFRSLLFFSLSASLLTSPVLGMEIEEIKALVKQDQTVQQKEETKRLAQQFAQETDHKALLKLSQQLESALSSIKPQDRLQEDWKEQAQKDLEKYRGVLTSQMNLYYKEIMLQITTDDIFKALGVVLRDKNLREIDNDSYSNIVYLIAMRTVVIKLKRTHAQQLYQTLERFAGALDFQAGSITMCYDDSWTALNGFGEFNDNTPPYYVTLGTKGYENPACSAEKVEFLLGHELGHPTENFLNQTKFKLARVGKFLQTHRKKVAGISGMGTGISCWFCFANPLVTIIAIPIAALSNYKFFVPLATCLRTYIQHQIEFGCDKTGAILAGHDAALDFMDHVIEDYERVIQKNNSDIHTFMIIGSSQELPDLTNTPRLIKPLVKLWHSVQQKYLDMSATDTDGNPLYDHPSWPDRIKYLEDNKESIEQAHAYFKRTGTLPPQKSLGKRLCAWFASLPNRLCKTKTS